LLFADPTTAFTPALAVAYRRSLTAILNHRGHAITSASMTTASELFSRGYGLVITAGVWSLPQTLALWEALSARVESLYLIGPLADKPVLSGGSTVWLLECPLAERAAGLREVLRRDPHGIVLIGEPTEAEATLVVQACLSGCLCIVSSGCATLTEAFTAMRALGAEPTLVGHALVGGCTPETTVVLTDDQRQTWMTGGAIGG
jgi:hypothetical protein